MMREQGPSRQQQVSVAPLLQTHVHLINSLEIAEVIRNQLGLIVIPRPPDVSVHLLETQDVGVLRFDNRQNPTEPVAAVSMRRALCGCCRSESASFDQNRTFHCRPGMNSIEIINVASRWVHIGTAIVVVGGTVFFRFVLIPSAEQLPQSEHDRLRELVMQRWRKFVTIGIALFLLSGFYNYVAVSIPKHHGDGLYHSLMGLKIVLAFGVFFLASVLVGRSARFEPLRQERKKWLLLLIGVAFLIVLISSTLRIAWS